VGTPPNVCYLDVVGGLMCLLELKVSQEVRPKAVRQEDSSKGKSGAGAEEEMV
jgi:hypothetical protein